MLPIVLGAMLDLENNNKFDILYKKYRKLVFKIAVDSTQDQMTAEDLVTEVYIKLMRNIDAIDDPYSGKSKYYLVAITKNICTDFFRAQKKLPVIETLNGDSDDRDDSLNVVTDGVYFEDFSNLEKNDIVKAIESLPDAYKDVLVLKYCNELDDAELAAVFGISNASVRKRIERARKLLKIKLLEDGLIEEEYKA